MAEPAFRIERFGSTFSSSEGIRPGYVLGEYECADCGHHALKHLCTDFDAEPEARVFPCEIEGCACAGWIAP